MPIAVVHVGSVRVMRDMVLLYGGSGSPRRRLAWLRIGTGSLQVGHCSLEEPLSGGEVDVVIGTAEWVSEVDVYVCDFRNRSGKSRRTKY